MAAALSPPPQRRLEPRRVGAEVRTMFPPCEKDEDCRIRIDGQFQRVRQDLVDAAKYQEQYLHRLRSEYSEHMMAYERNINMYKSTTDSMKNSYRIAELFITDEEVKRLFVLMNSELAKHLNGKPSTFADARAAFATKVLERWDGGATKESIEAALKNLENAGRLNNLAFFRLSESDAHLRKIFQENDRATKSYKHTVETLQHMKLPHTCCPASTPAQGKCRAELRDCDIEGLKERQVVTALLDPKKLDELKQKAKEYQYTPEAQERLARDKASFFGQRNKHNKRKRD